MDPMDLNERLDSLDSVEELDKWAEQHNISHDPAVNLRRLQLLCNSVSLQTGSGDHQVSDYVFSHDNMCA